MYKFKFPGSEVLYIVIRYRLRYIGRKDGQEHF